VLFTQLNESHGGGSGTTRPLPKDGARRNTPRRSNSLATPQDLDQKSKMEKVVPKMVHRRGSDAEQSRKR